MFKPTSTGWNRVFERLCCITPSAILLKSATIETRSLNGLRSNLRFQSNKTSASILHLLEDKQRSSGQSASWTTKSGIYLSLLSIWRKSIMLWPGRFSVAEWAAHQVLSSCIQAAFSVSVQIFQLDVNYTSYSTTRISFGAWESCTSSHSIRTFSVAAPKHEIKWMDLW